MCLVSRGYRRLLIIGAMIEKTVKTWMAVIGCLQTDLSAGLQPFVIFTEEVLADDGNAEFAE